MAPFFGLDWSMLMQAFVVCILLAEVSNKQLWLSVSNFCHPSSDEDASHAGDCACKVDSWQ